jgi:hypothetical protein
MLKTEERNKERKKEKESEMKERTNKIKINETLRKQNTIRGIASRKLKRAAHQNIAR